MHPHLPSVANKPEAVVTRIAVVGAYVDRTRMGRDSIHKQLKMHHAAAAHPEIQPVDIPGIRPEPEPDHVTFPVHPQPVAAFGAQHADLSQISVCPDSAGKNMSLPITGGSQIEP